MNEQQARLLREMQERCKKNREDMVLDVSLRAASAHKQDQTKKMLMQQRRMRG